MALRAAVLAVIGIALLLYVVNAKADPVYESRDEGGARVVLHSSPCTLKAVSNLPRRVVWHENGKEVEGCWGARPEAGVVVMYFGADRTVGIAPMQAFKKVIGT
jgi:hypothetical protein